MIIDEELIWFCFRIIRANERIGGSYAPESVLIRGATKAEAVRCRNLLQKIISPNYAKMLMI